MKVHVNLPGAAVFVIDHGRGRKRHYQVFWRGECVGEAKRYTDGLWRWECVATGDPKCVPHDDHGCRLRREALAELVRHVEQCRGVGLPWGRTA